MNIKKITRTFLLLTPLCLLAGFSLLAKETINPSDASLKQLMEGNLRYVNNTTENNNKSLNEQRKALVSSQKPFAIIVGCSDSRVPPEIIFDQSLGALFVVRVAGNVVGPIEMDSIEFSADQLLTPLILVLGHQGCGAVRAVLQDQTMDPDLANIAPIIQEAVNQVKGMPGDPLKNAIQANVRLTMGHLKDNSTLGALIEKKKLKIMGGYYELESGKVELLN